MRRALIAMVLLGCGNGGGGDRRSEFGESKVDRTRIKVKKFAFEAMPQWSMHNPGKACPQGIDDLDEYMADHGPDVANDAWGAPMVLVCGPSLPQGVKGVLVVSAGEDGRWGTPDDIKSTDP
jgi:hypothetical protein